MSRKPARLPWRAFWAKLIPFFLHKMEATTIPNPARGEITLLIAGQPHKLRFGLRVLHDYTTRTGCKLFDLGDRVATDFIGAVGELVTSAVRCCVPAAPASFGVGEALDVVEALSPAQTAELTQAIMQAVRIDQAPLFQALIAQAPQPAPTSEETNGASTSTSPSAS
jgi:hypothetical protein